MSERWESGVGNGIGASCPRSVWWDMLALGSSFHATTPGTTCKVGQQEECSYLVR